MIGSPICTGTLLQYTFSSSYNVEIAYEGIVIKHIAKLKDNTLIKHLELMIWGPHL